MVKIVGCEKESVLPVCSQPLYISLDRLYELCLLLGGVGIVKTQIEFAVVFLGQAVVQQNTLGMSDMKISVGFRRETGVYSIVYALRQIFLNDLLYKFFDSFTSAESTISFSISLMVMSLPFVYLILFSYPLSYHTRKLL